MLIDFRFDEDVDDQYGILTATRSDIIYCQTETFDIHVGIVKPLRITEFFSTLSSKYMHKNWQLLVCDISRFSFQK